MTPFPRVVAALALGLLVVVGLLLLLVVVNFTQRLEDPGVYNDAISDTGAYTRVYDEVLADESLREDIGNLLGGVDIAVQAEVLDVLREVLPSSYLQDETEDNVGRVTAYLSRERDDLAVHVNFKRPLERVEPAVLGKVHEIIDGLEIAEPDESGCSLLTLQRLASASAEPYSQFSEGELPKSAPSLQILSRECREQEFDRWFDLLLDDPAMDPQAARVLDGQREELRRTFIEGDTRVFLKAVADPLVKPLVADAVADIRANLDSNDRLDLLEWMTGESGGSDDRDIEAGTEGLRDVLGAVNGPVRIAALVLVILGCLLLAALHFRRPRAMLGWTGAALLAGGGVALVVGIVVNSIVPSRIREAVMDQVSFPADVPDSAIDLAADLLESFAGQSTAGFVPATVAVMVIGGALIAASIYHDRLSSLVEGIRPAAMATPASIHREPVRGNQTANRRVNIGKLAWIRKAGRKWRRKPPVNSLPSPAHLSYQCRIDNLAMKRNGRPRYSGSLIAPSPSRGG